MTNVAITFDATGTFTAAAAAAAATINTIIAH